jgi:hypothetical protein
VCKRSALASRLTCGGRRARGVEACVGILGGRGSGHGARRQRKRRHIRGLCNLAGGTRPKIWRGRVCGIACFRDSADGGSRSQRSHTIKGYSHLGVERNPGHASTAGCWLLHPLLSHRTSTPTSPTPPPAPPSCRASSSLSSSSIPFDSPKLLHPHQRDREGRRP